MHPLDISQYPKEFDYNDGHYRRSGPHPLRPGIVVCESSSTGATQEVALVEVRYRTRHSYSLADAIGNEAMTDIRIDDEAVGAIRLPGTPPVNHLAHPEVGEHWLVCDLKAMDDDTLDAGGAVRLPAQGQRPSPVKPDSPRPSVPVSMAVAAQNGHYEGAVSRILPPPRGYGFIDYATCLPPLPRDPYIDPKEAEKMKALGCDQGSLVRFKIVKAVHEGEIRLRAIDVRPA